MLRWTIILAVCSIASNGLAAEPGPRQPSVEEDQAVIAVALEDFSKWKKATFGEFKGVLAVEQKTLPQPDTQMPDHRTRGGRGRLAGADA